MMVSELIVSFTAKYTFFRMYEFLAFTMLYARGVMKITTIMVVASIPADANAADCFVMRDIVITIEQNNNAQ